MKLLFVTMTGRVIKDEKGNKYLNSHLNKNTLFRYSKFADEFHIIARDSGLICTESEGKNKFNSIDEDYCEVFQCYDPYQSLFNLFSQKQRHNLKKIIYEQIIWADRIILNSATGLYSNIAIKICKKLNKQYLILIGGFSFETDWYHGFSGKICSVKREIEVKKNVYNSPYVLYVTQNCLQKRYPTKGINIGVSDVEVYDILKSKINGYKVDGIINLGTMAKIDDKRKGHILVFKALKALKESGISNIKYHLLGPGDKKGLFLCAKKMDIVEMVVFDGMLSHDKVMSWLDDIDIYIQPSYTEGLCRAIVEAMSRGCPIIASNVGGNSELLPKELLFKKGDFNKIAKLIEKLIKSIDFFNNSALYSLSKSKEFISTELDALRNEFLSKFFG